MTSLPSLITASFLVGGLFALAACSDDANGSSDTGGSGGSGGSPGTGGTGGKLPVFDVSSIPEAVVLWDSCLRSDDGVQRSLNNAYYEHRSAANPNWLTFERMAGFVGKPATCTTALGSVGLEMELTSDCVAGCEDETATMCDGETKLVVDCKVTGGTCVEEPGFADCNYNPGAEPCDETFEEACVDGRPMVCTNEVTPGLDCASHGLECSAVTDEWGASAVCTGTGESCSFGYGSGLEHNVLWNTIACENGSLRLCVNGREHIVPCEEVNAGFTCFTKGVPFCGKGDDCDPDSHEPRCEDTGIVLCDAGTLVTVDCNRLGFPSCDPTSVLCK